uniref:Stress response protein NST1 n=1 Tax=Drosophila rhopaloa TaxID=1041015 RepID=A0A6P4E5X1_DRORH
MGGTKCVFRDCPVGSNRYPSMHFFKFPVKDPKRLKDWVRYCGNSDVSNAPVAKLAGKTVCARHFRAESFMNYKMDRLIPMQTPTLLRINRDLALDLENLDQNGEALLVKLKPPTQTHLIPPKDFECPLGFVDDDENHAQNVEVTRKQTGIDLDQRIEQDMNEMIEGEDEDKEPHEKQTAIPLNINEEEEQPPVEDDAEEEQEQCSLSEEENSTQNPTTSSTSVMPQNILNIINQLQPSLGIKLIKRPVEIETITEINLALGENQPTKEQTEDLTKRQMTPKEEDKNIKLRSKIREVINNPKVPEQSQKKIVQIKYVDMPKNEVGKREMQKKELVRTEKQTPKEQAKKRKLSEETHMTKNVTRTGNDLEVNPNQHRQEIIRSKRKVPQKPADANPHNPNPNQERQPHEQVLKTVSPCFSNLDESVEVSSESENEAAPVKKSPSEVEKLIQDYNQLKTEFDKMSEENAKLKRLQAEPPKAPPPIKPATNSLTKPQLYIAIKKYLGPTMAALLRMEMFGGSEDRTWKDDEREFAMELVQLGDEVYKYCCDEWRFRLPSLRTARSWLEKRQTEDVDDFLDL